MNGELQWPTLWEWITIFLILIFGSFIAGFIATWWERRKQDKEARARKTIGWKGGS